MGGWIGSSAGFDPVANGNISRSCRESNSGRQTCSPSLLPLSYPGSYVNNNNNNNNNNNETPWPELASDLYRPRDRRLSAKLVPAFVDRRCHVVSVTDPYDRILDFLDRSPYFFFQVAPQFYSRG
jgi:hypothetical protein